MSKKIGFIITVLLLPFCLFASFSAAALARTDSLSVLKKHVLQNILSGKPDDATGLSFAAHQQKDGSWQDIDYSSKIRGGWPVTDHLGRLLNMAMIYVANPGLKEHTALKTELSTGLDYWLNNDFICPNWWYPQIGVPRLLGQLMLLLEPELTKTQLEKGVRILDRAKIGMTGQNKVWLSGNVIYKSLLTGDIAPIRAAVSAIESEIVVSENEGVQPDYSFHQHGPQQQFGNYGLSFAGDMEMWASIFHGTPFQMDEKKIAILRNYLLMGMRWVLWKGSMDISACGRQITVDAPVRKATMVKGILARMPEIDPAYKAEYLSAMDDFNGNKHFWKSDMTIHHRKDFYVSVKMCSARVGGGESCNEENVLGYHLGDGATYFYQSGKEYTNIFPFWDWKLVPGTTTYHDDTALPVLPCSGYTIKSNFVGGVDDAMNGVATMAYIRDGVFAQKSWFFLNSSIVCLGAGIHASAERPVTTAVNQCLLNGKVTVKAGEKISAPGKGQQSLQHVSWVIHDKWGYYFPDHNNVMLSCQTQTGDWNRLMRSQRSKEMKNDVFTLWIDHGKNPQDASYAYYVFPAADTQQIDTRAQAIKIQNDQNIQVAEDVAHFISGFVFVRAGTVVSATFGKLSVDIPAVLLLSKKGAQTSLSIADPTHQQQTVHVVLPGNRKSKAAKGVFDPNKNETSFAIELPRGMDAGKSVQLVVE
ncbi:MAG: hypothetical protein J7539_06620 [Niabella sp.]|nr:hypothetical protein [Niabella sp.]